MRTQGLEVKKEFFRVSNCREPCGVTWWGGGSWIQYVQNPEYHYSHIRLGLALQHWRSCIPGDEWNCYTVERLHEEREKQWRVTPTFLSILFLCRFHPPPLSAVSSTPWNLPSSDTVTGRRLNEMVMGTQALLTFSFSKKYFSLPPDPCQATCKRGRRQETMWIIIQDNTERRTEWKAERWSLGRLWHYIKEVLYQRCPSPYVSEGWCKNGPTVVIHIPGV